jgi:hypothetical protein
MSVALSFLPMTLVGGVFILLSLFPLLRLSVGKA